MAAGNWRRIFIVDDDPDIVDFMAELLKAAGHEVASNPTGSHAISEIVAQRPDCALIDLVMAELDGLELCRELRARKDEVTDGDRRDAVLSNAPETRDGFFVVPKVIE